MRRGWALVDVTIALLTVLVAALLVGGCVFVYWLARAGWREWHKDLGQGVKR